MNEKSIYIGRINSIKRYNLVSLIVLIEIIIFFILLGKSQILAGISVGVSIAAIIFCFLKINMDVNLLIFKETIIEFHNGKNKCELNYEKIRKYEFIDQQRSQSFSRIRFQNRKLNHVIEREDGYDINLKDFAEFLLSKNQSIEILHRQTNFETYKYFRNNGEVKRVLIN